MTVTEDRPTNQQTQAAGRVVRVTGRSSTSSSRATRCPTCSTP